MSKVTIEICVFPRSTVVLTLHLAVFSTIPALFCEATVFHKITDHYVLKRIYHRSLGGCLSGIFPSDSVDQEYPSGQLPLGVVLLIVYVLVPIVTVVLDKYRKRVQRTFAALNHVRHVQIEIEE